MLPALDSLRCFTSAAKLLHFRAAARSVGLTPAAFGQRIKQLEDQLGAELFKRTTRSVQLTEAGLALLPIAERTLSAAAECVRVTAEGARALSPVDLTLGTRHELGMSWVLPELVLLEQAYPWLKLHLYFGSGSDLLLRVRSMEVDCAITSTSLNDPKLDTVQLHREDYVLVGAPALLAKVPLMKLEHASAHTLIDTEASLPLFRYFRDAPDSPGDRMRFANITRLGTIAAIHARVLACGGVAVLPEYLVRDDLARKRLSRVFPRVNLLPDWFRLVFRKDDPRRLIYERIAEHMITKPLA
jgi:LysR family glycine cleavage system transcriptional activator